MVFKLTQDKQVIDKLRKELYQNLSAPIDAMWELLYIASAKEYIISENEQTLGYCCIDDNDSLLQLFISDEFRAKMNGVIKSLIDKKLIKSASLSSNAPLAFNTCLLHSKTIRPNTFCYQHTNSKVETNTILPIDLAQEVNIPEIISFLKEQINFDDTFGYTKNLVAREEIYFVKEGSKIIAISECRWSDSQPGIADLGVIVHKNYQGKGMATQILQLQANRIIAAKKKPICSTTQDNIASQKAIEKAGFYCSNIIFDMLF